MSNMNHIIKSKAEEVYNMWCSINSEFPDLSNWDLATKISNLLGCELIRLPEEMWKIDDNVELLGETDGKNISLRSIDNLHNFYTFFHEVGHVLLHYKNQRKVNTKEKELEADMFALRICLKIWPGQKNIIVFYSRNNAGRQPFLVNGVLLSYRQVLSNEVYPGAELLYKMGPNFGYCKMLPIRIINKRGRTVSAHPLYSEKETITISMSDVFIKLTNE